MAAERTVACPHCGAPRTTKANPGVGLACQSCGERFLVPKIDPGSVGPQSSAAPRAPGPDPSLDGGVTVKRGRLSIPQAARPRGRAGDADPVADDGPATQDGPPAPDPAPSVHQAPAGGRDGRTGDVGTLTRAGRRGGLARYAQERRRAS